MNSGHWRTSAGPRFSSGVGNRIVSTSSVMAIAKTPSAKVSSRPVSVTVRPSIGDRSSRGGASGGRAKCAGLLGRSEEIRYCAVWIGDLGPVGEHQAFDAEAHDAFERGARSAGIGREGRRAEQQLAIDAAD